MRTLFDDSDEQGPRLSPQLINWLVAAFIVVIHLIFYSPLGSESLRRSLDAGQVVVIIFPLMSAAATGYAFTRRNDTKVVWSAGFTAGWFLAVVLTMVLLAAGGPFRLI